MHIPDGYLSPQTCAVGYAVAVPFWFSATRRVKKVVKNRSVAFLAVLAALSFLVMMFNVPIPDGTTAHAVGAGIIAITLGPWAATIAVSVALLFQALLFGDGGVLAYGTNVVNMAIILPFVALAVYRVIAGDAPLTAKRRIVAGAIGGYLGINAAALAAAIELGIQPGLFHTASGAPLYAPYHLTQTIPAMLLAHLTIAGSAEAILTGGIIAYLQRADVNRLVPNHPGIRVAEGDAKIPVGSRWSPGKVAVGFIAMAVAVAPLGLLAPGGAFGEDSPRDLDPSKYDLSGVPSGLEKYNSFWDHAVLGGYGFSHGEHANLGYILSAIVGIAVVGAAIFAIAKIVQSVSASRGEDQSNEKLVHQQ